MGSDAMTTIRVLHLDGDPEFLETVAAHLERADDRLSVRTETSTETAIDRVEAGDLDCLLTEVAPPDSEPLAVVERVAGADPDLPVVVVDDGPADETAAEALAAGAAEFMPRSTDPGALQVLANRVTTVAAGERSSDDLEALATAAPVGLWLLDDGTVSYANAAAADLFGRDREALVGSSATELVSSADRGTVREHVGSLLEGDRTERTDVVTGGDPFQEHRVLEFRGRRTRTPDGPAVVGAVQDVTAARLDERRLRTLVEGLAAPVAEVTLEDGRAVVRSVNQAFEEVFGVEAEAVADGWLADHVVADEDDLEDAIDAYLRLERGEPVRGEVTRATADGRRQFELQGLPFEAGGGLHAMLVYSPVGGASQRERDLTALQAVARDLMAADGRDEVARIGVEAAGRLLDTAVACLFVLDDQEEALVPLAATDEAEALFDGVPAIPAGEGAAWYVHEMGDPVVTDDVRSMETVYDPTTVVRSEMLLPVGDHGVFVASATEEGVFDDRDEALGRTLASTLEAALADVESERLLRERERELVRENERLEEFAGIVSHDLRSPLAVVKGNTSLLREEGKVKYLDRIEAAADRMESLIEDLLSLARQGSMVEEPEYVELEDVVTRAWTTADTRRATLEADLDVGVEADPSRLQQLLENLFTNAVEHGSDDVAVRVDTIEPDPDERPGGQYGRHVEGFYVADDGPGLPEDRADLFEPGTTTEDDGTGFGLAIVKRIAEAHGWTVETTESEVGGARFEFRGVEGV
jgi:PAS domain S-box-containing protein